MKLPWYMKSANKGMTIIVPWYGIVIILIKRLKKAMKVGKNKLAEKIIGKCPEIKIIK